MKENLDIAFLGGLFPKEFEKEILNNSKGNIQHAANNLQWAIVSGLDDNLVSPVQVINSLYIGSFPKRYTKIWVKTQTFSHCSGANKDINVGFSNLTGIKNFSRLLTLKPHIKRWALQKSDNRKVIIAYAMTHTCTSLLKYVKSINENIITCLIVPDLPQYMNLSSTRSKTYEMLKNIEIMKINKDLEYIDGYVLLTKHMKEALELSSRTVVIEGIATDEFLNLEVETNHKSIKTILYSGGLFVKYGIIDLIKAFERLENPDYRLVICGAGDAESDIVEACNRDNRIVFKGQVNRNEVLKLQKSSTVLVNPRSNNEEYTKFSFPSKILEYLSSGTPMLAYKLDGIPNEYTDYYYCIDEVEDGIYKALLKMLSKSMEELESMGAKAKEFVLNQKNKTKQAAKIINLINEIQLSDKV